MSSFEPFAEPDHPTGQPGELVEGRFPAGQDFPWWPQTTVDTPVRNQGQAGACPDRTRAIPARCRKPRNGNPVSSAVRSVSRG
jgi:hypothetical protein